MYTSGDSYYGDYTATMDALGHLSVNENQDIRYHDKSAGLHLLAHSVRNDDAQTQENGIWKFRSPKSDPTSSESNAEPYIPIHWPPSVVQDHLIHLYFTYVHPFYPVVHKSSFLGLYNARKFMYVAYDKSSTLFLKGFFSPIDSPKSRYAKSIQGISDLLLLSMFAFAARYSDDEMRAQPSVSTLHDQVASGGRLYAEDARKVLNTVYQHSRPSTCQALLLMGVREFGVGSTEQGWLFVGMACRMAVDLGMNHNADEWKDSRGEFLFSIPDRQARRQIWASCCIADKLSSIWQGRPVMFRECDYNVNFPTVVEAEEMVTWQPYPPNALGTDFKPEPGRIMSNFREQCKLSLIMSEIMTKIYPVQPTPNTPKRAELEHLETRLHHWLFELPDHLRYREAGGRVMPLPHILALHIEYQFAVLLLHRAFIPNWNDSPASSTNPGLEADALPMKSFDICQGAAAQISSTMSAFEEHYGLSRCPPLFIVFLQGAAIMHIVTLMRRPGNTQGTVGLMRCIDAAKAMETTWPCAIDVRRLLQGSRVQLDDVTAWESSKPSSSRPGKRAADDAFGMDGSTDVLQQDIFEMMAPRDQPHMQTPTTHTDDTPDGGTPYYAQALGVPVSMPVQSPNAFYSGFEWWPQSMLNMQQYGQAEGLRFYPSGNEQQQDQMSGYPAPQGPFTFDDGQLSSNFTDHVAGDDEPSGSQSHLHHSDQ
ncbi:hypothetical protein EUX98_g1067 [Antrodiella citrinella]|uniref:Xylanolytic transcriptional activator regulatory domain-containing protein n=1 Tax=Antrodiella citrinella TaxID=2447956 RepID=A0A4S4N5F3_9APHY|nr:hypothetical protein EUX98_g1067 [Antrodiella citrinella]